jgi:hypothetical protein
MSKSLELALWSGSTAVTIPSSVHAASDIVPFALQLSRKDQKQIISSFESEHFEMMSSFVWNKAIASLKRQLGKLGIVFIAEMLNRPDIDESSNVEQKMTDFEAIRLAEELGIISGTGAFRLRQSMERIYHFGSLEGEEADSTEMSSDEAIGVLRACVENILGHEKIEVAMDFANFRNELESRIFKNVDSEITRLLESPYFFKRTTIRVLLSLIKTTSGAQLENTLANTNLIIPSLWKNVKQPEKWQIGRTYSEVFLDGKTKAASGLKSALLKVSGFDYVPEDLRSNSYVKAANEILKAHESINNYYNEPAPMKTLCEMGSVIPIPAFSICMTATMCIKLGNAYGYSYAAQKYADNILNNLTPDRWSYFINECLSTDERLLYKLLQTSPSKRWCAIVDKYDLNNIAQDSVKSKELKVLISSCASHNESLIQSNTIRLLKKLGYKTD